MPQIYISGPVVRHTPSWDLEPWIEKVYEQVETEAAQQGRKVLKPVADPGLDQQEPREFFHSIRKRIADSKAVISVFGAKDVSGAVETSIASVLGKKILVIAEDLGEIPRLISGLPGVTVVSASNETLRAKIANFMRTDEDAAKSTTITVPVTSTTVPPTPSTDAPPRGVKG